MSLLIESTSHTPLEDQQDRLSDVECGYLRHRRNIPFDAYCTFSSDIHFSEMRFVIALNASGYMPLTVKSSV